LVEVRSAKFSPIAADVRPSHVVDQHDDDVRFFGLGAKNGEWREKTGESSGESFHGKEWMD
jgi:hypothetical protein